MKKMLVVLILVAAILTTVIFVRVFAFKEEKYSREIITENYYSISGLEAKIYGDTLVVYDEVLKVIDLNTKEVVKTIEIPGKTVLGFDIYEDKIIWSDLRNEKNENNKKDFREKANSDIFLYDISKGTVSQITSNTAAQENPVIWGNYIAWQDNRDDEIIDGYPQWNIYLYDIEKKTEKRITKEQGIHTDCRLYENYLIWEDGRNFSGMQVIRLQTEMPINNTDIYMYIIDQDRYLSMANGVYKDSNPDIWKKYIVWESQEDLKHNADIKLYDIETMKIKNVTEDKFNQKKPDVSDEVLVWVDEGNGFDSFDGIEKEKNGKSDIGIFDMLNEEKIIIEEEGAQTLCSVTPSYIVYSSRLDDKSSEIKVLRYYRKTLP
jgi:beta propeller repeat protein